MFIFRKMKKISIKCFAPIKLSSKLEEKFEIEVFPKTVRDIIRTCGHSSQTVREKKKRKKNPTRMLNKSVLLI